MLWSSLCGSYEASLRHAQWAREGRPLIESLACALIACQERHMQRLQLNPNHFYERALGVRNSDVFNYMYLFLFQFDKG